jgi:hypothetical protein
MFDLVEMFGFCCGALLDLRGRLVGLFPQDTITGGRDDQDRRRALIFRLFV